MGSLIGLIVLFLLSVWIFSGNTPEGGTKIAKKGRAQIGGIKQGYFIRGENERNPVILFLHGGPRSPELSMIKDTEPEKHFTVCYRDQRGAGMTFFPSNEYLLKLRTPSMNKYGVGIKHKDCFFYFRGVSTLAYSGRAKLVCRDCLFNIRKRKQHTDAILRRA